MSAQRYGISTSEITWEQEEGEIEQDDTGKVTIQAVGCIGVGSSNTALDDALSVIPKLILISDDGPIGNCTRLIGASKSKQSARFMGDDTIQVSATYEIADPTSLSTPDGGDSSESDSDRASRTIVAEDAPILSHPLVQEFDTTDRRLLASLLAGDVRVNPRFDSTGSGKQLFEFIRDDEAGEDIEEVDFSDADETFDDVTASPLDYARIIAAGVQTWRRPVIRHSLIKSRENPAPNAEYGKVGETITGTPQLAPNLAGDGQWFLNGITDTTDNGVTWVSQYEFERTGAGGALKAFYKGGTAEMA